MMLKLLLSLLAVSASLAQADLASSNSNGALSSPGSSLRANNPILLPLLLCSTLWSTLVGAQAGTSQQPFVDNYESDIEDTIVYSVVLDDDDNDYLSDINDDFANAPSEQIQFGPLSYYVIFAAIPAFFVLGLWASYDMSGGSMTSLRMSAVIGRARSEGGLWSYALVVASSWVMRALVWLVQVGFVVIGLIYVLQQMYQWTVIQNYDGTQTVIAERGLFIVAQAPSTAAGTVATITPAGNVVPSNFPPFLVSSGFTFGANSELVISPSQIQAAHTWYIYIVSSLLIAIVFFNLAMALVWKAGSYILAAISSVLALAAFVLVIVFTALELSDLNPGQTSGEEIAMVIYAAFATLAAFVLMAYYVALAVYLRDDNYRNILANDDENALIEMATSTKKHS